MAFISVLDLNNGFEFDVRLPLGGQSTDRPRAVLTPENDLFFVSYNRVMRWGYLSSALTTVWTARPAHHAYDVMLFVGAGSPNGTPPGAPGCMFSMPPAWRSTSLFRQPG